MEHSFGQIADILAIELILAHHFHGEPPRVGYWTRLNLNRKKMPTSGPPMRVKKNVGFT